MSEKFWILHSSQKRLARWDEDNIWEKTDYRDRLTGHHKRKFTWFGGPASRLGELRVLLRSKRIPDFVWTIPDCLIQDRTLDMLRNQGFTGFEARPTRVRWDKNWLSDTTGDEGIPRLWELLVMGWGGMARPESGVLPIPDTDRWEGRPDWSRIIDWNSWDGSDFFLVWPFGFTRLVSDRVAAFIVKHKVTGARLFTPEEYTRFYMSMKPQRISPMRLRDFFPEKQAREIGEPLGIY